MSGEAVGQAATPIRVLVAEDVAVNRELIKLMLEDGPFEIDLVADGLMAIEAVSRTAYNVVLMDMQMPGLDGLGATRAIRNLGGDFEQLPIIGLSANSAPGQVNRCLEAGMTDHLAKPFSAVRLKDTIWRWAPGGSGKRNPMIETLARHAGVNRVRALLDLLVREIEGFETVDPGDTPELLRRAHALRGAAALLGYGDLAHACKSLEQTFRADADPSADLEDVLCLAARVKVSVSSEPLRAH